MLHSLVVRSSLGDEVCPKILKFQLLMGTMGKNISNGNWPPKWPLLLFTYSFG